MSKTAFNLLLLLLAAFIFSSCSNDDDAPVISGVWKNMVSEPIEQTSYAYPGQTICLHGSGFSNLRKIFINGTDVDFSSSQVYDTDSYITIKLPADVNASTEQLDYIRVITAHGEDVLRPFIIKPTALKPSVTSFSSTTLVAGRTLTITGTNLDGATEVYLPLAFDSQVKCAFDETKEQTATSVSVIIPDGVSFASGKCVISMEKTAAGITFIERVYSATTNFNN